MVERSEGTENLTLERWLNNPKDKNIKTISFLTKIARRFPKRKIFLSSDILALANNPQGLSHKDRVRINNELSLFNGKGKPHFSAWMSGEKKEGRERMSHFTGQSRRPKHPR